MGLFSIFKRKPKKADSDARAATRTGAVEPSRLAQDSEAERAHRRELARATAMKIDAIESAMAFDIFNTPEPAWRGPPKRIARPAPGNAAGGPTTLPMEELTTTVLLGGQQDLAACCGSAESAPVIEEIAITVASGQLAAAEQMLVASLAGADGHDRALWWMLFDLYQIKGEQDQFDSLSIDYASRFETSPPAYLAGAAPSLSAQAYAGPAPTEALTGVLDAHIEPQLQRLLQLADSTPVFRLELGHITDVNADGCARLLTALARLRAQQRELILAGADELVACIRATIEIGRREASDAPWLLLLELLQLMNREKDFEESAMDYCVTYEVSPPSFIAPARVATAASSRTPTWPDRFMLPSVVDGAGADLLEAIDAYAAQHQLVVFDCLRLSRVGYGTAGALLQRLRPLADAGKTIEFRDMNHLVAALFKLLGFADIARIFPRKY